MNNIKDLIEASLVLELKMSELYKLMSLQYREDSIFWHKLSMEEDNHASIYETFFKEYLPVKFLPEDILAISIDEITEAIQKIENTIKSWKEEYPGRLDAYETALEFEKSSSENRFQQYVFSENDSKMKRILEKLLIEDEEHKKRIEEHILKIKK